MATKWKAPPDAWKRALELAEDERDMNRAIRNLYLQTLLGCVICCSVGLFLVAWALHTTDEGWAAIAFWSGLLIGDAGMFTLLLRHYGRLAEQGY